MMHQIRYLQKPLILLTMLVLLGACRTVAPETEEETPPFPRAWTGIWRGTCRAVRPDGGGYGFPMELHILETGEAGRWTWQLVYGEGEGRQIRDYALIDVPGEPGHFRVDEKNSIVIDAYRAESGLYSLYSVGGALMWVTYRKEGDALCFELVSTDFQHPVHTGGEGEIPRVAAYPVQVVQQARLFRQPGP